MNVYPASLDQGRLAALKLLPLQPDGRGQLQKMAIRESVTACALLCHVHSALASALSSHSVVEVQEKICQYWSTLPMIRYKTRASCRTVNAYVVFSLELCWLINPYLINHQLVLGKQPLKSCQWSTVVFHLHKDSQGLMSSWMYGRDRSPCCVVLLIITVIRSLVCMHV